MLRRAEPALRTIVRGHLGQSAEYVDKIADYEIRAIAFEAYVDERTQGRRRKGGRSFPQAVRAIFDKLMELLERIRNALRNLGFKSAKDVFSDVYEGRMAQREPKERPIGPSASLERGKPSAETVQTADGPREQLVIPGAEKISDKELAERRFAEPKRPNKEQKSAEGLPLFGDSKNQGELFSLHAPAQATPTPNLNARIRERIEGVFKEGIGRKIIEGTQDLSHPMRLLQDELEMRREGAFEDPESFYTRKRLYPGRVGAWTDTFNRKYLDPIVKLMKANGISLSEAGDFLYALHAAERNAEMDKINPGLGGEGSGMSNEEAEKTIAEAERGEHAAAYEELRAKVAKIRDLILDVMEKGGLEKPEVIDNWREQYQDYVPLRGWEVDARRCTGGISRTRSGFNVRGKEVKQAFGRRSKADNPLVNLFDQAYRTFDRAERNRYLQSLYRAIDDLGERGHDIATLDRGKPQARDRPAHRPGPDRRDLEPVHEPEGRLSEIRRQPPLHGVPRPGSCRGGQAHEPGQMAASAIPTQSAEQDEGAVDALLARLYVPPFHVPLPDRGRAQFVRAKGERRAQGQSVRPRELSRSRQCLEGDLRLQQRRAARRSGVSARCRSIGTRCAAPAAP